MTEETLDCVAVLIEVFVENPASRGGFPTGNNWFCARPSDGVHGALPIITFVRKDIVGLQTIQQRLNLSDIIALTAGQNDADRVAKGIR